MGDKTKRRRRRRSAGACPDPSNETLNAQNGNDYQIGYGKPPRNTQFRPGQSGNPKGRPRGSKNLGTLIDEELSAKVTVSEGGKRRVLSKRAVIAKRFVNKAAEGDIRTLQTLFKVHETALAEPTHTATADEQETIGADDRAILEAFEKRLLQREEQSNKAVKGQSRSIRKRCRQ